MTKYLTTQQILFINSRILKATGGEYGIRDLGLLQSAVARPQATFDGKDLYPGIFDKAAALMQSLAQNHPFVDGNKRIAITAAALFLQSNGRILQTSNAELEHFTFSVVNEHPPLDALSSWFAANSVTNR